MLEEENQYFMDSFQNIRNPVSLVKTPLIVAGEVNCPESVKRELSLAIQNMEFLESHLSDLMGLKHILIYSGYLDIAEHELGSFMRNRINVLRSYAPDFRISLNIVSSFDYVSVWFDTSKVTPVIDRFIMNAMRYISTEEGISISLSCDNEYWEIKIKDSDDRRFFRYYRYRRNWLLNQLILRKKMGKSVLTKKLLNLCKGRIVIYKNDNSISLRFPINCPFRNASGQKSCFSDMSMENNTDIFWGRHSQRLADKYLIIIADSDDKFRYYLERCLSEKYIVKSFDNGLDAYESVKREYPDLVICDINLSGMNGDELSSRLKTSADTSIIPVILLGSHIDLDKRKKRHYSLADSFVFKPLNPENLKVEISVLINNSRSLRKSFLQKIFGKNFLEQEFSVQDANLEFLTKVKEYVLNNLDNEGLTIDNIANVMFMSRTKFFNKWKMLTGECPQCFVHKVRMEKAREFLESGNYSVNEIPELIGMKNLKNFRNKYKEYFGKTPKESIRKA